MPTRKADPKEKQERLITELAVKRAELAQAEEAYKEKKVETDALLAPFLEAKNAADAQVEELEGKIKADFSSLDKKDLIEPLTLFNRKTWAYEPARAFQWAMLFSPHVLTFNPVAWKEELNSVADSKKRSRKWFEELGCPVEMIKVPEISIEKDLSDFLPAVVPETKEVPAESKAPAEIAEQISGEPDISAVFMPLEDSGEASE